MTRHISICVSRARDAFTSRNLCIATGCFYFAVSGSRGTSCSCFIERKSHAIGPVLRARKKTSRPQIGTGCYTYNQRIILAVLAIFRTIHRRARDARWNSSPSQSPRFTVTAKFHENGGALAPFLAPSGSGGKSVFHVCDKATKIAHVGCPSLPPVFTEPDVMDVMRNSDCVRVRYA